VSPSAAVLVLLLVLAPASLQVIRGVRSYIGAESVWSNAQKATVQALEQYAQSRNEDHLCRYGAERRVRGGARAARLELERPFPDFALAQHSLLAANNHPADIGGMIDLFRRFRFVRFMAGGVRR